MDIILLQVHHLTAKETGPERSKLNLGSQSVISGSVVLASHGNLLESMFSQYLQVIQMYIHV